jgi:hypothetical protein
METERAAKALQPLLVTGEKTVQASVENGRVNERMNLQSTLKVFGLLNEEWEVAVWVYSEE